MGADDLPDDYYDLTAADDLPDDYYDFTPADYAALLASKPKEGQYSSDSSNCALIFVIFFILFIVLCLKRVDCFYCLETQWFENVESSGVQ